MYCRKDGPCLAPWLGFFAITWPGIDKTSYLALSNCRFLSDGCMHLPQVHFTMPTSQYKKQSGRNPRIVSSKKSRRARRSPCYPCWWSTPSTFRWTDWIPQSGSNPLLTSHGSGASRTVESAFLRFPCDWSLLPGLLSEVYVVFCNHHYRDEFPRASRFVRFDGRQMFSLRD